MDGYTYQDVFSLILTGLIVLAGIPLTQWMKQKMGVSDKAAMVLAGLVSGILAVVQLVLEAQLTDADFTVNNLPNVFFLIFGVGQFYYKFFRDNKGILGEKFMVRKLPSRP